jgi:DNA invertase Pin-like site-specific DNA recombinase
VAHRVYAYLRASTAEQDACRAQGALDAFAKDHGLPIAHRFVENESGASLKRPELFRLLDVAQSGDVLLIEQVDRLSRLNETDWQRLRSLIDSKGIRVVTLDLPTSWNLLAGGGDEFTRRMLGAINGMLLDMLAAIARKDYADRRRRQADGIAKAKAESRYRGRPTDAALHARVRELLTDGKSWNDVQRLLGCSRSTIARVVKAP